MAPEKQIADTKGGQDAPPALKENFAELLEESLGEGERFEGRVVTGIVVEIDNEDVIIDVGLKSEGRVSLKEFATPGVDTVINTGDKIDVFVERFEDRDGIVRLSREKARREEAWTELEKAFNKGERVNGSIFGRLINVGIVCNLATTPSCGGSKLPCTESCGSCES